MLILFMFIALIAMICLNVPIAVALAISAVIGLIGSEGPQSLVAVGLDMYNGSTNFALIAIPMFLLSGAITNAAGNAAAQDAAYFSPTLAASRGSTSSEERRVGKASVRTCRFRWSPEHYTKTLTANTNTSPDSQSRQTCSST